MRFDINVSDIEKINPLFSKCKVNVLYTGINRNNSYISKETVENAMSSIFNIPIVGEYLEQSDNFGGHGGKIEISDRGIEYIQTTKPYGVVPESAEIYWESITEENGETNEYLIIDGAYLWTGRYEELGDLLERSYGQSMEIEVKNGDFAIIDGTKTFKIEEFLFSALCILGVEKDGEGHVEPCFEGASITAYSFDKQEFKNQFNQMVAELKFSLSKEGGNTVDEKLELMKKFSLTEETLKEKEINLDDFSLEELEVKFQEITQENNEPEKDFSLVASQLKDEIRSELYKEFTEDEWGWKYRKYWYVDHTDGMVIAEDSEDNYRLIGFDYSVENDVVSIDFNSKKRIKLAYEVIEDETELQFELTSKDKVEYELNVKEKQVEQSFSTEKTELESKVNELSTNYEETKNQLEELQQFKSNKIAEERSKAESEIFGRFTTELTETEIEEVKAVAHEFSLEQLEEKLFTLVGKKKAKFSINEDKKSLKVNVDFNKDDEQPNPYGDLFSKYAAKE